MKTSQYGRGRNPNSLKNLKRNTDRDPEELREMGRKGGTASGKARRAKSKIRRILQKAIEEYIDIARIEFCSFGDIAEDLNIPYHEEPRLVWLVIQILSYLEEDHKRDLLTRESLQAMGLNPDRIKEIMRRWNRAMKETPEPNYLEALKEEYRQALKDI